MSVDFVISLYFIILIIILFKFIKWVYSNKPNVYGELFHFLSNVPKRLFIGLKYDEIDIETRLFEISSDVDKFIQKNMKLKIILREHVKVTIQNIAVCLLSIFN